MLVEADLVRTDRQTHRHTDTQTHRPTTVTLASACARRGLIRRATAIDRAHKRTGREHPQSFWTTKK